MKIADVRSTVVANRFRVGEENYERLWSIVEVDTDQGITGIGRTTAYNHEIILETVKPLLLGEDPFRVEMLWEKMYSLSYGQRWWDTVSNRVLRDYRRGRAAANELVAAIGGVDVALWDIVGKALGQPIYKLLGGYSDRCYVYGDGGIYYFGVEEVAQRAADFIHQQGFEITKVHFLGDDHEKAIAKVKRARELIGPQAKLAVDVHRIWSPQEAIEVTRTLEEYDILWIEEPIYWDDQVKGMAILAEAVETPVAAGEGEWTLYACRDLVAEGGVRILQPDTVNAGGFTQMRRIAAVAMAYHAPMCPHGASYPEINCHMMAAIPNGWIIPAWSAKDPHQIWSRMYQEPIQIVNSYIQMNDKPGLGMELDRDWIAKNKVG